MPELREKKIDCAIIIGVNTKNLPSLPCQVWLYWEAGHFVRGRPIPTKNGGTKWPNRFPPVHQHTSVNEVLKYYSKVPPDNIKQTGQKYFSDFAMVRYVFLGRVKSIWLKNSWFEKVTPAKSRQWPSPWLDHEMTWEMWKWTYVRTKYWQSRIMTAMRCQKATQTWTKWINL